MDIFSYKYDKNYLMRKKIFIFLLIEFFLCINIKFSHAFKKTNNSNFMSLKAKEVNLRAGPNKDFLILYTYKLRHMPIKVIGEYDKWFNIIDKDGDKGWISENLVSKAKFIITINDEQMLYFNNSNESFPIYMVEKNVIGKLIKCENDRCKVKIGKIKGWLNKKDIWGFEE